MNCTARPAGIALSASAPAASRPRRAVAARALDTNLFANIFISGFCGAAAAGVTIVTSENRDKEIERIQTVDGALPIGAAIIGDAVLHSIPGFNVLFQLIGAACGVAYMMLLLLSSKAVDPTTLAPKGTVVAAEKATDNRSLVRVPFSQIIPTAIKVVDTSNQGFSGAGWEVSKDGLPKLPVTSVAIVVGVGSLILEAAGHAPILSTFMPRVLTCAACLALAGWALDKRESTTTA